MRAIHVIHTDAIDSDNTPGSVKKNLDLSNTPSVLRSLSAFNLASRIGFQTASTFVCATVTKRNETEVIQFTCFSKLAGHRTKSVTHA